MTTRPKKINFVTGNRVRYSPAFMKSISAPELSIRKGTIIENRGAVDMFLNAPDILMILWADSDTPKGCLSSNLVMDRRI